MKKLFSLVALAGIFMLMSFGSISEKVQAVDCDAMASNFANDHSEYDWCQAYDAMYDTCNAVFN